MKQLLSFQLTFSQKSTGPSTEATLCTTVSSSMSSSTDIGCKDVSKPPAHNDNPFIATSDDETRNERSSNEESDDAEEVESDSDTDSSHIEGVRKLSEIRFPSYVHGLVAPGIQCSRDEEAKSLSLKQAERLCNIANDDPLRTPQKKNGTLSLDTYQQPDTDRERTPQMSIKRSRPEEDYETPTKNVARTPSPFGAPLIGYDPKYIPKYARSRTKPTKFCSTTPTKVRKSPNRKQSE
ncbi:hypothetical protein BGW37DRAFT_144235 [Umbelopsis sp. PMI_123]|nr:hypothetical protein BGW37DRAFT_144235 [Umbelopsis sp. PMI_123]